MSHYTGAYEPFYGPNLTLLTCYTINREALLDRSEKVEVLRSVLRQVQKRVAFRLVAYVYLLNHAHFLLDWNGEQQSQLFMNMMTNEYEKEYQSLMGTPSRRSVWQRYPQLKTIHTLDDFVLYLDAIHYDPVRHSLANRPEEWPYSSYETWVERSVYKLGWGWAEPESLSGVGIG
ncbi:MAG: hypothetical protein AAF702_50285 [Chloroflexota bacterium]